MVADELNISKAAKKLFISQQGLSKQIKALEKEYGVPLFSRRPVFALTPYGEALKNSLEKKKIIEQSLGREFHNIQEGTIGTIKFGIHFTRARVILPKIYMRFQEQYPNVTLSVVYEETPRLKRMLLAGELDCMIGVNTVADDNLVEDNIITENIFLVMSRRLLQELFNEKSESVHRSFAKHGADLKMLNMLPFISNDSKSQAQSILNMFLAENNIQFDIHLQSTDHYGNILLAGIGTQACCCPQSILDAAAKFNQTKSTPDQLCAYRIKGLPPSLRISILRHQDGFYPQYLKTFHQIVREETIRSASVYEQGII